MSNSKQQYKVLFSAGKSSGDQHAAHMFEELQIKLPNIKGMGMGGSKMRQSGIDIRFDSSGIGVIGLIEILKHYGEIRSALKVMKNLVVTEKPDLLVCVDYKEFNLKLARFAKKLGIIAGGRSADASSEDGDRIDLHEAQGLITAGLSDRISFRYENAAEGPDLLTPFQRAQSISFVTRFDHLPPNAGVAVAGDPAGGFIIANMADVRHVLHEYRPILQNQHDSVYHQKLHSTWRRMLLGRDAAKGTVVTVLDHDKNDITP